MSEKPPDPWEGTWLFPPQEPNQNISLTDGAEKRAPGQPEEHRAEIIITLAVISLFPIFGLIAFAVVAMAWTDLRKMAEGKMDRSGRTQTLVGLWLAGTELLIIAAALAYVAIHAFL